MSAKKIHKPLPDKIPCVWGDSDDMKDLAGVFILKSRVVQRFAQDEMPMIIRPRFTQNPQTGEWHLVALNLEPMPTQPERSSDG